jgi:hypothetical protein
MTTCNLTITGTSILAPNITAYGGVPATALSYDTLKGSINYYTIPTPVSLPTATKYGDYIINSNNGGTNTWITPSNANVSIGSNAGGDGSQSLNAVAIGGAAGQYGQSNYTVAIGYQAGNSNQGQYAIAIGAYAGQNSGFDGTAAQPTKSIVINASGTEIDGITAISPAPVTGGFFVAPINGVATTPTLGLGYDATSYEIVTYLTSSDQRLKTNISNTALGINFINQLRPVQFTWKDRRGIGLDSNGNLLPSANPGKRLHQGFIAQEVKQVLDNLSTDSALFTCVNDVPSTIKQKSKDSNGSTITTIVPSPHANLRGIYTLRHEEFIAPTVKAIQEVYTLTQTQQSTIQLLEAQVSTLQHQQQTQQTAIQSLEAQVSTLIARL